MGKLFWRIFLGLWLGSAALMVGTSAMIALSAEKTRPPMMRDQFGPLVRAAARSVLDAVDKHDATKRLQTLERDGVALYIFDRDGREFLGRPLPPELSAIGGPPDMIRDIRDIRDVRPIGPRGPGRKMRLVDRVMDTAGQPHQVIAALGGPPPPPPLGFLLGRNAVPILLSIAIAGLISALVARHLVNPIAKLRAAAGRLASGELDYRVGNALVARNDEFTALADDFDRMATRIGNLIRAQRRLMLDLSHELRSPLARLRIALELMRGPNPNPSLLDRMERDTERMDILIGELLLLARLESLEARRVTARIDLTELVGDVVEDANLEATNTGHPLLYHAAPVPIFVNGDRELLRRAVENVVRNALQHTPPGTEIEIDLRRDAHTAEVRIADSGPGVSPDVLAQLFNPFVRGEGARHGGNGLGLAISRGAVLQHGGDISASPREGRSGLVIRLTLPIPD
jgi:signal transduction histidine kinase